MDLKQHRQIEAMANNLKRTIPASHKDAFYVHQAPLEIAEIIDDAFELAKMEAVKDYIESQPEGQQDTKTLSKVRGQLKLYQSRVKAAEKLSGKLTEIALNYQIEEKARAAGAINPSLIGMYLKNTCKLTHKIDGDGDIVVLADGGPIENAVKSLAAGDDTRHMFGANHSDMNGSSKTYSGRNPWVKATFNLTEQGQIFKKDPALAARLMKAARVQ
jgi:hypothetical protein